MTMTIVTHLLAFLAGGGGVFIYLHKHQLAAVNAASGLASAVAEGKTLLTEAKTKL
jgi:hypothetical protein